MKTKTRNKYGVYFGLNVADRYSQIFSRWEHNLKLPGWDREIPVIGANCAGQAELVARIDELIRDLERLKKWGVKQVEP